MARRIGFVSTMNAIARDSARRQRQEETEKKRQERTLIQAARKGILKGVLKKQPKAMLNLLKK